jgi:hypothetical protein
MAHKKLLPVILAIALLGLSACSSAFGDGSPPPKQVEVVVPPSGSTTTYP